MLAEIDQPTPLGLKFRTFSLRYWKTDGSRGSKAACYKGGKYAHLGATKSAGGFRYNHKLNGTLQLVNDENGQPFAVKIALITRYNGLVVIHSDEQ
ncbi:hypothetical protein GCM10027048_20450 [Hymenobacter coalescens]